jgi:hypothetical protein
MIQNDIIIYIAEELGRWGDQHNYLTTIAVNMNPGNTFTLFLPIHHVHAYGMLDDSLPSPFRNPVTLTEVARQRRRLSSTKSSLLPLVR